MMVSQAWMAIAAAILSAMIIAGMTSPAGLLACMALLAIGFALNNPVQSALWPELVPRPELPQAVSLYSISNNGARLIGPAVAGALLPLIGAATVVALNALSTLGVIAALLAWRRTTAPAVAPRSEPWLAFIGGAVRFARHTHTYRAVLLRGGGFFVVTAIVLAILPVKVPDADDFGFVFSFFGLGAVLGALAYGRAAAALSRNRIVAAAVGMHAVLLLALSQTHAVAAMAVLTGCIGFTWFFVMSALQIGAQMVLPDALRGRGLALLNLVLMGGYALGSPLWGAVAAATTPDTSLAMAAVLSLGFLALTARMPLPVDTPG
jgi:MFS family permease